MRPPMRRGVGAPGAAADLDGIATEATPAAPAPQAPDPDLAVELHRLVTRIGLYAFAAGALSMLAAAWLAWGTP